MIELERRRVTVEGNVQGVGFRPFVYRLAIELGAVGYVENTPQGVTIEVEAARPLLDKFLVRLKSELPPHAEIHRLDWSGLPSDGDTGFVIRHSRHHGAKSAVILPDLASCPDCLREIRDPANRRYRYPFTNCTHCGPRYSIIESLPYDRAGTTMRNFEMCPECLAEYENPLNRRFHAQPNACPVCGPQLELWDATGAVLATRDVAIKAAAEAVRQGKILALKGLGGFHLMVDARSDDAVRRLRSRKARYEKPLAVMFPSVKSIERVCMVSKAERRLLQSAAAPIVLLRSASTLIARSVAPGNPYLGAMLPYTPLHHLLLAELGFAVVATSGNLSGEPIVTDNAGALEKLAAIADVFLVHDRPIARPVDDSVAMVVEHAPVMLRRSRGYAPAPLYVDTPERDMIAVGAHQKGTAAVVHRGSAVLSQHLGDMDHAAVQELFERVLADLRTMYGSQPEVVACDLHPDYPTTRWAQRSGLKLVQVQHHYAHALACMAEHCLEAPVLAVVWDGTGFGMDGTIWGGEFLRIDTHGFTRVASLRPFPLPGGDLAAREPRRSALGLLYAMYGRDFPRSRLDFTNRELDILSTALDRRINSPMTSSIGRLFDAVAALIGLRQTSSFEGQAAMGLEFAQDGANTDEWYPYHMTPVTADNGSTERLLEWMPMISALLVDEHTPTIAAKFHNTLAAMIAAIAAEEGEQQVVLTGGCFQNRVLLEKSIRRLRADGFTPYWPQLFPPNDGAIALGQVAAALREFGNVFSGSGQSDGHQRRGP